MSGHNDYSFECRGVNQVMSCDGFYISYNPSPCKGISFLQSDGGSDETALCVDDHFFVLNGDFREVYKAIAHKGLGECLKFFNENEQHHSSWSSGTDVADFLFNRIANINITREF